MLFRRTGAVLLSSGKRSFTRRKLPFSTSAENGSEHSELPSPLSGVRVLDLSRVLAGPYCTMILGDLGAEVIKVEHPQGDETRHWGPPFLARPDGGRESAYYLCSNRNKKSVCVDFKKAEGVDLVRSLSAASDVVVENFVPGKLDAMGLGYDDLKRCRDPSAAGLIYCSVTGFGPDGPYAKRPGYDVIAASIGGLMHITGPKDGPPCKVGVALTDVCTGLYAHGAIMAALVQRGKDGKGQKIDCNLMATQVATLINMASSYINAGVEAHRAGSEHPAIVPYQTFKVKDGWMTIGCGNDRLFRELCSRLGRPDLPDHPHYASNELRVKHRSVLVPLLEEELLGRTLDEWEEVFSGAAFPYGAVNPLPRVFGDPHVKYNRMVREVQHPGLGRSVKQVAPAVKYSGSRNDIRSHPPSLGEHTDEVLSGLLGLDQEKISHLRKSGVVA